MTTKSLVAGALAVALAAPSLVTPSPALAQMSKEDQGTIGGALLGGAVGSMFGGGTGGHVAGGIIGAVVGGVIGNQIGRALDEEDRRQLEQMTRRTITTGGGQTYRNRKTGVVAKTRVTKQNKNAKGEACRTVEQEVVLKDGTVNRDTVSACRGPNGWVV